MRDIIQRLAVVKIEKEKNKNPQRTHLSAERGLTKPISTPFLEEMKAAATLDRHATDQMILFAALAEDKVVFASLLLPTT